MEQVYETICKHCNYRWVPRVKHPKYCPRCKLPTTPVSSAKPRYVVGVKSIEQQPTALIWCQSNPKHDNVYLAMFEWNGTPMCLQCMQELLTTMEQITVEDVLNYEPQDL